MKMTIKDEAHIKDKIKKVKNQKKDNIPEIKTETTIKTEKMPAEIKKKKKRKLMSNPENVMDDADVEVCKKKQAVENEHPDSAENLLQDEAVEDEKKHKKVKTKSKQPKFNVEMITVEDTEDDKAELDVEKTSKNANKVKRQIVINAKKNEKKAQKKKTKLLAEEDISVIETAKAKKSKKKSKLAENGIKIDFSESDQVDIVKAKKKKKRKDKNIAEEKEIKPKINKDYKESLCLRNGGSEEIETNKVKKKKNKKSKPENEMDTSVDKTIKMEESFDITENLEPKKKKKKTKVDKEPLLVEREVEAASKSKKKKHSKNIVRKVDTDAEAGTKKKKKKIKEEQVNHEESAQMEVVFLSEKAGNTDEVNVNTERRKALQMEIDQASQPKKPANPLGLGQWSTAEFGSSEQQQKFLRLMGGFKKGFQPASVSGGNMALGRDAQQQLQQGLLGEFERAHSRRMDSSNKGTGLGFIAPSTKKFSIDANATRSIRFDD